MEGSMAYNENSRGIESDTIKVFTYEDLQLFTDNFCEKNLCGKFQWGNVYRGHYGSQVVMVKKWGYPPHSYYYRLKNGENEGRLKDEILLLQHSEMSSHPNMVKLIGYCCVEGTEDKLGVVYDLNPLDSLRNLTKKNDFTWLQRIKVILEFASVLEFMHVADPPRIPCLIRNICADHIMLDQDYNSKLFDFGMISGGIFPDRRWEKDYLVGCVGFIYFDYPDRWSEKVDVCAFGIILQMLLSKRYELEDDQEGNRISAKEWTDELYKRKVSIVHKSLIPQRGFYARDARKLSKLSVRCTEMELTITDVVKCLLSLRVVRFYGEILGIEQILLSHNRKLASHLKRLPATAS